MLYIVPAVHLLSGLEAMLATQLLVWLAITTLACAQTITTTDQYAFLFGPLASFNAFIYSNSGQTVVEVVTTDPILGIPTTSTMYAVLWLRNFEGLLIYVFSNVDPCYLRRSQCQS